MLKVFRIANPLYILDLSGEGARLHGGRWNNAGTPVLYAASSIALAAWEVRVHLPNHVIPKKDAFSLAFISIPGSSICDVTGLKPRWQFNIDHSKAIGEAWLAERKFLAMRVPSTIVEHEFNYLINPAHPMADMLRIDRVMPFLFDLRTFG